VHCIKWYTIPFPLDALVEMEWYGCCAFETLNAAVFKPNRRGGLYPLPYTSSLVQEAYDSIPCGNGPESDMELYGYCQSKTSRTAAAYEFAEWPRYRTFRGSSESIQLHSLWKWSYMLALPRYKARSLCLECSVPRNRSFAVPGMFSIGNIECIQLHFRWTL
jgi:hypothetical protein